MCIGRLVERGPIRSLLAGRVFVGGDIDLGGSGGLGGVAGLGGSISVILFGGGLLKLINLLRDFHIVWNSADNQESSMR